MITIQHGKNIQSEPGVWDYLQMCPNILAGGPIEKSGLGGNLNKVSHRINVGDKTDLCGKAFTRRGGRPTI